MSVTTLPDWLGQLLFGYRHWTNNGAAVNDSDTTNAVPPLVATFNTNTGKVDLSLSGSAALTDITLPPEAQPALPSSGWTIFVDSADGQLKAEDSAGNVVVMSSVRTTKTSKTLVASNATAHVPIFQVTGPILFLRVYGVVTTVLGANHTAVQFTLWDQTTRTQITAVSGAPTASGFVAGALLLADWNPADAAGFANATAAAYAQNGTGAATLVPKNGATTVIEYTYTTTDTPTSGAIQFSLMWQPLSSVATVTAL